MKFDKEEGELDSPKRSKVEPLKQTVLTYGHPTFDKTSVYYTNRRLKDMVDACFAIKMKARYMTYGEFLKEYPFSNKDDYIWDWKAEPDESEELYPAHFADLLYRWQKNKENREFLTSLNVSREQQYLPSSYPIWEDITDDSMKVGCWMYRAIKQKARTMWPENPMGLNKHDIYKDLKGYTFFTCKDSPAYYGPTEEFRDFQYIIKDPKQRYVLMERLKFFKTENPLAFAFQEFRCVSAFDAASVMIYVSSIHDYALKDIGYYGFDSFYANKRVTVKDVMKELLEDDTIAGSSCGFTRQKKLLNMAFGQVLNHYVKFGLRNFNKIIGEFYTYDPLLGQMVMEDMVTFGYRLTWTQGTRYTNMSQFFLILHGYISHLQTHNVQLVHWYDEVRNPLRIQLLNRRPNVLRAFALMLHFMHLDRDNMMRQCWAMYLEIKALCANQRGIFEMDREIPCTEATRGAMEMLTELFQKLHPNYQRSIYTPFRFLRSKAIHVPMIELPNSDERSFFAGEPLNQEDLKMDREVKEINKTVEYFGNEIGDN